MVSKVRVQRIADRIHEELSMILLMEVADPRLAGVSVSKIKIDRELAYANIYVSSIMGAENSTQVLEGLNHARGFLRSELASRIHLRSFPRLRFHWDPSPEHVDRIDQLIASLHEREDPDHSDSQEPDIDE
jgi:ribosome-binding factor A